MILWRILFSKIKSRKKYKLPLKIAKVIFHFLALSICIIHNWKVILCSRIFIFENHHELSQLEAKSKLPLSQNHIHNVGWKSHASVLWFSTFASTCADGFPCVRKLAFALAISIWLNNRGFAKSSMLPAFFWSPDPKDFDRIGGSGLRQEVRDCWCTFADKNVCKMKTKGFGLVFKSSSTSMSPSNLSQIRRAPSSELMINLWKGCVHSTLPLPPLESCVDSKVNPSSWCNTNFASTPRHSQ